MLTLQVEHEVASYEAWKKAFDGDPIDRKKSGVKRYRIYKPHDNARSVIIELDFENMENLQLALQALQQLWNKVQGTVMVNPKTRIIEIIESKDI